MSRAPVALAPCLHSLDLAMGLVVVAAEFEKYQVVSMADPATSGGLAQPILTLLRALVAQTGGVTNVGAGPSSQEEAADYGYGSQQRSMSRTVCLD